MENRQEMSREKRILDSVHGYITIPEEYCDNIIDTSQFQRLRRVEQTSIRSVFPCARHDRFMHSLGVYHVGCKILQHIQNNGTVYVSEEYDKIVYESYGIACLLHDVCHSPFSHTFEDFYNFNKLLSLLKQELDDEVFNKDCEKSFKESKPHELMSALMVIRIFGDWIRNNTRADVNLIVRMITGIKYLTLEKGFDDVMIDLIHGKVDADGMDYACRDVWASGYSTSMVDIDRLIRSITILQNENGQWILAFDARAKNEIEGFLNVKTFHYDYVFSHHTILYEQELLKEAMKSAALFHLYGKKDIIDEDQREKAIRTLCDVESFYHFIELPVTKYPLFLPMDDDFVALMKYIPEDKYVRQWFSRQYEYKALWKNRAEWLSLFPIELNRILTRQQWFDKETIRQRIYERFSDKINIGDIIVSKVSLKNKIDDAQKLLLYTHHGCCCFNELYKEEYPYHSEEFAVGEETVLIVPRKSEYVYIYLMETDNETRDGILRGIQEIYNKEING